MSNEVAIQDTTPTTAVAKIDNGKPALYNPAAFDQIWRASKLFASSDLVPTAYKNKPENCFIAIEMADRMGISPFAMLQSLVIIQGRPSMEAKLIIALVNDSGIFADPLEYEIIGDDPHAQTYKVRAFATMKKSGKLCQGPWITYQMVKGEGWLDKGGSKWKTMPSIMFMYRAASFFAKVYCPNITMGMQTREELEDSKPIDITPERKEAPALVSLPPVTTQLVADGTETPAPSLVAVQSDAEIVDIETGEIIEAQPSAEATAEKAKRNRRTKEQIEAEKQAAQTVVKAEEITPSDSGDEDWPDPPPVNTAPVQEAPPHPAEPVASSAQPEAVETVAAVQSDMSDESEEMGDLF